MLAKIHFWILLYITNILYACAIFWLYIPWLRASTQDILWLYMFSGAILIYLPLNILLFYGIRRIYRIELITFGWNSAQIKSSAIIFLIFGIVIEITMLVFAFLFFPGELFNPNLTNPLYYMFGIWTLLGELLGNSLFEEMMYRGLGYKVMQEYGEKSNLKDKPKIVWSFLILQAVLFSLMHIPNRIYNKFPLDLMVLSLIIVFGIGLWLGYCYHKTKSISFVIILHALNNIGVFFTNEYFLSLFALVPLSFIGIYLLNRKKSNITE